MYRKAKDGGNSNFRSCWYLIYFYKRIFCNNYKQVYFTIVIRDIHNVYRELTELTQVISKRLSYRVGASPVIITCGGIGSQHVVLVVG